MSVGTVTEGTIPFDLPRDEAQAIRVTLRRIMFASIPSHLARRWPIFLGAVAAGFAALLVSPELALAQFMQQGPKLVGTLPVGSSEQGWSVALSADGNTAIAGGPFDNNGNGAAWVFVQPTKDDCKNG